METFTQEKKEKCKDTNGLLAVLSNRFKPCHSHIILALQYQKHHRKSNESAKEWMSRLLTKVAKSKYIDPDRLLTEQFIGGLNDNDMTDEILRKVTNLEHTEVTNEHVLSWVHKLET